MLMVPDSKRLQTTLDDLKRRLKLEREESETMTHDLSAQREQGRITEDSRVRRLELELATAQQQITAQREEAAQVAQQAAADHREMQLRAQHFEEELAALESRLAEEHNAAEKLAKEMRLHMQPAGSGEGAAEGLPSLADYNQLQAELATSRSRNEELAAERDATAQRLKDAETWSRTLEEEESKLRAQLETQSKGFEAEIAELHAERDEARANLQEVEGRTRAVEEEFVAAQEKSREQREAAREVIQQMESECDDNRNRLGELEARAQALEEELAVARGELKEARASGGDGSAQNGKQMDIYRQLTVPLTLVMASTDLLALNSQTSPQLREAVRAVQQESRIMLESLRQRGITPQILGVEEPYSLPPPAV